MLWGPLRLIHVCLPACRSVGLSVGLSVCLSVCLPVCLSACLSVGLSVSPQVNVYHGHGEPGPTKLCRARLLRLRDSKGILGLGLRLPVGGVAWWVVGGGGGRVVGWGRCGQRR